MQMHVSTPRRQVDDDLTVLVGVLGLVVLAGALVAVTWASSGNPRLGGSALLGLVLAGVLVSVGLRTRALYRRVGATAGLDRRAFWRAVSAWLGATAVVVAVTIAALVDLWTA